MITACGEGVLPASTPSLSARTEALIAEARSAERTGRRTRARECFEGALRSLPDESHAPMASALLRWIGRTYIDDGDLDAAHDCFEAALAAAEAAEDPAAAAHAINTMAAAEQQRGNLDLAERRYRQALAHAVVGGETRLQAMIHQNLGTIANIRGDLTDALRSYRVSLGTYQELGLDGYRAALLNNVGMLLTDLGRWRAAERAYADAHALSSAVGDQTVRVLVEVNRAQLWIARRHFGRARVACLSAIELAESLDDVRVLGEVYKHLGVIARESAAMDDAARYFEQARTIAEERHDPLLAAEVAREHAELHWLEQRGPETLKELSRAHRLFSQLRARRQLADVTRRLNALEASCLEIVRRWGESIESKDRYTSGHCERVADYASALAREAGFDEPTLFWFRAGALLHDVGKLIVPSEILNKSGRLTPDERALIERHPVAGEELLAGIEFPWDVRPMVRHHHERWDGAGYPDGLQGEQIPLSARILCLADVYDALTTDRPYRPAFAHDAALQIMRDGVGQMFDPQLYPKFEEIVSLRVLDGDRTGEPASPSMARSA